MTPATLPGGRPGQLLAVTLLLLALLLLWTVLAAPLLSWYADRAAVLDTRHLLLDRTERLAATLPVLRGRAAAAVPTAPPVIDGPSDTVAAATLQQRLGEMAGRAGVPIATAEILPAEQDGAYRRIRLRITFRAPYPALVSLLAAIAADPALVVDDLQLRGTAGFIRTDPALDASWTVLAFRPGTAP